MKWDAGDGDVVFQKDGTYWCHWSGSQWLGSWKIENGKLIVIEGKVQDDPDSTPQNPITWEIVLDKTGMAGEGNILGNERKFPFKLTRP
jgi:hypothetical protein